ncbi:DUF1349 domain-containing protein [Pedobacter petrophilus]|uniref:DUF1349 domain-containing protein n=1 Tax=Pedobacter petrophilus TaxID=1908241 RepID=A0A7K0G5C4_9SPHI|nr:DUF1349 domain-containing protein [Pedobacter petrophilus]MRX78832.1 DUF1349 domain-containing protein [Pedobacter petrophilus]
MCLDTYRSENYIKTGVAFVTGKFNISTVVTNEKSDWSVAPLNKAPSFICIKAVHRLDTIEIYYSLDDKNYIITRNAPLQDNCPVMVGLMAACPDGNGFEARFESFSVMHLPDQRRLEWLKQYQ